MALFDSKTISKDFRLPYAQEIIVLDLEWTSWPGFMESSWSLENKYREIIQIGAVRLDYENHFREVSFFNLLVKPKINTNLSDYIQNLTGITQKQVDLEGWSFVEAYKNFKSFCDKADYLCWNGSDDAAILETCKINEIGHSKLLKGGINIQPLLAKALNLSENCITSGDITTQLGLPNIGKTHNALDDARSLAAAIRYLHKRLR